MRAIGRSATGGHAIPRRRWWTRAALAGGLTLALVIPATASAADGQRYAQRNLLSDIPGVARGTDANLVNPWGLALGPAGAAATPLWVNDNGTGLSTIYPGGIAGGPLTIAPLAVGIPGGAPTGIVFNGSDRFSLGASGPAKFIFDAESGAITAWNPGLSPIDQAVPVGGHADAVYKGLAIAGSRLYAADFHNNRIEVLGGRFQAVTLPGDFTDPGLPAGFAPFNIQALRGHLFVAYAEQDATAHDEVAGPGLGFVDEYSLKGRLIRRFASGGTLDAPWGMAIAPRHFGAFRGDVLVGNFGDGRINAFDRRTGAFAGQLLNVDGAPLQIDGLWGLLFGNGVTGTARTLIFSAGIADESHGLLGEIVPAG